MIYSSRNRVYFSSEWGREKEDVSAMCMSHSLIFLVCSNSIRETSAAAALPKSHCMLGSLNCFIKRLHECFAHSGSDTSVARHLTFILMMSVTQLTWASLVSQQKCLRRESSVAWVTDFHLVIFTLILTRWLDLVSHGAGHRVLWGDSSLITVNRADDMWAGCHYLWLHSSAWVTYPFAETC